MIFHKGFYAMGTRFYAVFPGMDNDRGYRILEFIRDEINRIESKLSIFISESEISKINNLAFKKEVTVSAEMYEILKICQVYSEITQGAFNIFMRPVLLKWKNGSGDNKQDFMLSELLSKLNMKNISINDSNKSVRFNNEDLEIDLGGFGKGYALEKIKKILGDFSVESAFLSFGESSVMTIGNHPAGDHWKVGLKNYSQPQNALHTFNIRDRSISTSSNFYVDDHGKLQNHWHVIDPATGFPVEEIVTVSVCSDCAMVAEILSTAFLVSTEDVIRSVTDEFIDISVVKAIYTDGEPEKLII